MFAAIMTGVVYPIQTHWAWGEGGWLTDTYSIFNYFLLMQLLCLLKESSMILLDLLLFIFLVECVLLLGLFFLVLGLADLVKMERFNTCCLTR